MNKRKLAKKLDNILMKRDKDDLLLMTRNEVKDLKLLTSLRNSNRGPSVSKIKPEISQKLDIDKLNKTLDVINDLSDRILKQREIEYVEMNKNMVMQLMENHNYGLFFGNPIQIKIDDNMEDKAIKIKYRR